MSRIESWFDTDAVYFFMMCLGVCFIMYGVDIYLICVVKFFMNQEPQIVPEPKVGDSEVDENKKEGSEENEERKNEKTKETLNN
mmetsp:Transcript_26950/g.20164  ORF Transcript_26950/g.20164 Transcript_26950/m.20164 type:complete len:84 (+) Transcript_26950:412-663(+)